MKLHDAIKTLVAQFGESVVAEVRLANLLADLNAYGEYPSMKQVVKESLKLGYGRKLLELYRSDPQHAVDKCTELVRELAEESNYKEDLISYGFDCILFGLGCLSNVNEPLSQGFDPYTQVNGNILDNLTDYLSSYQKRYLDLLDRLITKPKDILSDAAAYYSAEAMNELYAVEAKIHALQQQLGIADVEWCTNHRKTKLADHKKQKTDAVKKELAVLKGQYQTILTSSIMVPRKLLVKRSGYYLEETLKDLSEIETGIRRAYYNLGQQYDDWCEREKEKYIEKYKVEPKAVVLQLLVKIGMPAAVIIFLLGAGVSYLLSYDSIKKFEESLQTAEQATLQGNYGRALRLVGEAKSDYDATFIPFYYHSVAERRIVSNVDKAVAECTSLLEHKKFFAASTLLKSLPQDIVAENEDNAGKVQAVQASIDTAVENGLNDLIANISQNNGHLDEESMALLGEFLATTPDDYWLNFIKNREE